MNGIESGDALDDDEPEQDPRVHDRRDAHDALAAIGDAGSAPTPASHALPETRARVHDRELLGDSTSRRGPRIGHRDDALEHPVAPGPDLGGRELHAQLERLGQLQQQLVHRHRSRHAAAEGLDRFVGRTALAVHPTARELVEAAPHG